MSPYKSIHGNNWLRQLNKNFQTIEEAELLELATEAETIAGTDNTEGVTPAGLQAKVSSVTAKGLVELATAAETLAVTDQARVVTPYGLGAALAALDIISFVGVAAPGPCVLVGAKVGDVVFGVTGQIAADVGNKADLFEAVITVEDEIQQSSATVLTAHVFMALLIHMS